jgi:tape measure domain-containing protein
MSAKLQRVQATTVRLDQATRQAQRSINSASLAMRDVAKSSGIADGQLQKLVSSAKSFITVMGAIQGGKAFISLGMEMETTRAKFEVLLGSADRANKMVAEIAKFANETPYGSEELQKSAETMLGFGIAGEKIMPTLEMLGNVAMGDKQKLASLTLAFSQATSTGKLMGQDLLQMINAGFNPLNEMSKQTGKSIAQLKDEMSKGLISAQMLEDAFRGATSAGGQFDGMMDKMSETTSGKLAVLLGDLRSKLTNMAEGMLPAVNSVLDVGIRIVANFENIAKAVGAVLTPIKVLATGFISLVKFMSQNKVAAVAFTTALVALKIATIQATLATKGWTIASKLQYYWLLLCEKAQLLLNKAMYKNPVLAVVGVISMLVGALMMLKKRTKEAADEFECMKSTMSSYYAQEKTGLDQMFARLKKTNPESKERNALVNELKSMYPDLNGELEKELRNTNDLSGAYDVLLDKLRQRARLKGLESLSEQHNVDYANVEFAIGEYAKANNMSRDSVVARLRGIAAQRQWNVSGEDYMLAQSLGLVSRGGEQFKGVKEYLQSYDKANKVLAQIADMSQTTTSATGLSGGDVPTTETPMSGMSAVTGLTSAGRREQNINITFRSLIENYNMKATTVKEGITELENELVEGLLRVVNSANRIATQ